MIDFPPEADESDGVSTYSQKGRTSPLETRGATGGHSCFPRAIWRHPVGWDGSFAFLFLASATDSVNVIENQAKTYLGTWIDLDLRLSRVRWYHPMVHFS